jgi:hypothetical protein
MLINARLDSDSNYEYFTFGRIERHRGVEQRKPEKKREKEELKLICHLLAGQGFSLLDGGHFLECWCPLRLLSAGVGVPPRFNATS